MQDENPMEIFRQEAPEVAQAFDGLIDSLIYTKGLDAKTKQLVYIGMKAAEAHAESIKFHVPMAKKLGATRAEIIDVILLTLTVSGLKGVTSCLPIALKAYDEA
jgi:alkylhydroperoxidase/carboxymuconolactone decarboxylase family protein YurZ